MAHQQMPMQTPQDFFIHELSDMLSAENIIEKMLGEAQGLVQEPQIKQALQMHQEQTQHHIQNITQAFQHLGTQPHKVTCTGMKGIHQELKDIQKEDPSAEVLQAAVLGGAEKTEHYEITSYNGLIKMARAMGQTEVVTLLQQNLQQEQQMAQRIESFSDQMIQRLVGQQSMNMGTTAQQQSTTF